jgi:nucleoside-diphosphate-sugar epimerase
MRVLVVGCGYVGLPLALELAGQGHAVTALRRNPAPISSVLREAAIQTMAADISEPDSLRKVKAEFDIVVDCVASAGGTADDYQQVYFEGMRNLVGWLARSPVTKLIYTSSTSVYGQTDGSWVDERSPAEPQSQTAQILLNTERLLLESAIASAIVLRLSGIYGPGRGYWFRQFIEGKAAIEGAGDRVLNMIHRDDVVRAVVAMVQVPKLGGIYNVSDDEPVTQRELLTWFAGETNLPLPQASASEAKQFPRAASSKRICNRKLKKDLGFQLKYPTFREGYRQAIEQFRSASTNPKRNL